MSPSFILESIRAFLSTKPLLTESESWTYKVPEDKETQLYDFYLLLSFKQIIDNPKMLERGLTKPGWDEDTLKDLYAIVDDGLKVLVDRMSKDYLEAGAIAIASELTHVFETHRMTDDHLKEILDGNQYQSFMKYWNKIKPSSSHNDAYKAFLASGMSLDTLCRIGEKLFPLNIWRNIKFGGDNWFKIAKQIRILDNTKDTKNRALALDRVIDLVHNTGLMVDKSDAFAKDGDYGWIKNALDAKKDASAWQMAHKSSFPETVVGKLIKLTSMGGTKEDEPSASFESSPNDTKPKPDSKTWHQHLNGEGWVENTASVAKTAYVGPYAMVYDKAKVFDRARIFDHVRVFGDAQVYGEVSLHEFAVVCGHAKVYDKSTVYEYAKVYGNAQISENAKVFGNAQVFGEAKVGGNAKVSGDTKMSTGTALEEQPATTT